MRVLTVEPGQPGVRLADRPEPQLVHPDDVLLDVIQVGICGTDRDEAGGGRAEPPPGARDLVIGHEALARVARVGTAVTTVRPDDHVVLTVRRPCTECAACRAGRADLCFSGQYTERGIKGADGYQAERIVEREQNVVPLPASLASVGVLVEPLSIGEKAIAEGLAIQQARLPGLLADDAVALVAGLGPVGLLAAVVLRLRGLRVLGLDVVDGNSERARVVSDLGGEYVDGRVTHPHDLHQRYGRIDFLFEATGAPALEFGLLSALGADGIYVLTGIASGSMPVTVDGATLMRGVVLANQAVVGSVNAAHAHFEAAVADLQAAERRWPGLLSRLITDRLTPEDAAPAFEAGHRPSEIKAVVEWQRQGTD